MKAITTTSTPALQAVLIATEERNAFWRHYEQWVLKASDDDLLQLQAALDTYVSSPVCS